MSIKQRIARRRNWNKFRLLGIKIDKDVMTCREKLLWDTIEENIKTIIEEYEMNNNIFGIYKNNKRKNEFKRK